MSRDDILRIAREAGLEVVHFTSTPEKIGRFAALVAAAEREACAKICDHIKNDIYNNSQEDTQPMAHAVANFCAAAIRARGEQEQPR